MTQAEVVSKKEQSPGAATGLECVCELNRADGGCAQTMCLIEQGAVRQ